MLSFKDDGTTSPIDLRDDLGAILERAAALAAMLYKSEPAIHELDKGRHPVNETAYALWLEIQDAKTCLSAYYDALWPTMPKEEQ
jgi:hypothetical protein